MAPWPLPRIVGRVDHVNTPQTEKEIEAFRRSLERGVPFGDADWTDEIIRKFDLLATVRPRGHPRKKKFLTPF